MKVSIFDKLTDFFECLFAPFVQSIAIRYRNFIKILRLLRPRDTHEAKRLTWWQQQPVAQSTGGALIGHLDSIVAYRLEKSALVIVKGWMLHQHMAITSLSLERFVQCAYPDCELIAWYGTERPDILDAFPSAPYARMSGFYVVAEIDRSCLTDFDKPLEFSVCLANGQQLQGVFQRSLWHSWPVLPWQETASCNKFIRDLPMPFIGAQIVIIPASEAGAYQEDKARMYFAYQHEEAVGGVDPWAVWDRGIIYGEDDLRRFFARVAPLADSITIVGDTLQSIVKSVATAWISLPRSATITYQSSIVTS